MPEKADLKICDEKKKTLINFYKENHVLSN